MVKHSKKGSQTQLKIIATAAELFHKNGVYATSVDHILQASNTGKSQFYHYFQSKEGLVQAVLEWYYETFQNGQAPFSKPIKTWQDLENWCHFFVYAQNSFQCERGCPIGTIANEIKENQENIRQHTENIINLLKENVLLFFIEQKQQGKLIPEASPDSLAEFVITTMQGGALLSKIRKNISPLQNSVEHLIKYLQSWTSTNTQKNI